MEMKSKSKTKLFAVLTVIFSILCMFASGHLIKFREISTEFKIGFGLICIISLYLDWFLLTQDPNSPTTRKINLLIIVFNIGLLMLCVTFPSFNAALYVKD